MHACNSLTNFGFEAQAMMTGNGIYSNMEKIVKSLQVNLFSAGFIHLDPLCVSL